MWSDCSKTEFTAWATGPLDTCTDTTDMALVLPLFGNTCGDGVIDEGEDCDCGFANCNATDTCCDGITCKYTMPDADCASSQDCCNEETCQTYKTEDEFVCRAGDFCAAAEFCNTGIASCPTDRTAITTEICEHTSGLGTCSSGSCVASIDFCSSRTGNPEICTFDEIATFDIENDCAYTYCRDGSPDELHVSWMSNMTVNDHVCSRYNNVAGNGELCQLGNNTEPNQECIAGMCVEVGAPEGFVRTWKYRAAEVFTDCCNTTTGELIEEASAIGSYVCSPSGLYIYPDQVCSSFYRPTPNSTLCSSIEGLVCDTTAVVSATDEDDSFVGFFRDSPLSSVFEFFAGWFGDSKDDGDFVVGVFLFAGLVVLAIFLVCYWCCCRKKSKGPRYVQAPTLQNSE